MNDSQIIGRKEQQILIKARRTLPSFRHSITKPSRYSLAVYESVESEPVVVDWLLCFQHHIKPFACDGRVGCDKGTVFRNTSALYLHISKDSCFSDASFQAFFLVVLMTNEQVYYINGRRITLRNSAYNLCGLWNSRVTGCREYDECGDPLDETYLYRSQRSPWWRARWGYRPWRSESSDGRPRRPPRGNWGPWHQRTWVCAWVPASHGSPPTVAAPPWHPPAAAGQRKKIKTLYRWG